ncbi:MAG: alpha/beta hydrolase [Burkholderiaceae bacterium]
MKSTQYNRRSGLFALAITVSLMAACGGGGGDTATDNSGEQMPAPAPAPAPVAGDFVSKTDLTVVGATNASSTELIVYKMRGVDGELRDEQAVVMLPTSAAPASGFPMVIWGHGTTGIGDSCAPSATNDLAGYAPYLNGLLAQGFAIVAPDYEGLGTPGLHHYLNLQSEGRSMLFAGLAAANAYPNIALDYVTIGHSQGGHAALGAAELASEVSALKLAGVVALAPASNVRAQGDQLAQAIVNPATPTDLRQAAAVGRVGFSALILAGLEAKMPSFDLPGAFGPDGQFLAQAAVTQCTGAFFEGLEAPVETALQNDGNVEALLPESTTTDPDLLAYLTALEPGLLPISAPVLLVQGGLDTTVFPQSTQALESTYTAGGTTVTLSAYPTATHTSIVQASVNEVVTFIATQFGNAAAVQ